MTYCDYAHEDFHCKPEEEFFKIALRDAKVTDDTKCYFVDDSKLNCEKAKVLPDRDLQCKYLTLF